jgi:site-specific recombinase XerD
MSILMTILPSLSLLNKINQFIQTQRGENFLLNYGLFLLGWKSGLRVSEAVSFDYSLKHPRHKNLYSVKGKGSKNRYVYVSKEVIQKLKNNH